MALRSSSLCVSEAPRRHYTTFGRECVRAFMQSYRIALRQCTNSVPAAGACMHAICALNRVHARSYE
jgi:hypothetical protein